MDRPAGTNLGDSLRLGGLLGLVGLLFHACVAPPQTTALPIIAATYTPFGGAPTAAPVAATTTPAPVGSPTPALPPTPDPPRDNVPDLSALGPDWYPLEYVVQADEELGQVAANFGLSYEQIRLANGFTGGERLLPGQVIIVPQRATVHGPADKLIPDSELVYGPATLDFDVSAFVYEQGGYLAAYQEELEGVPTSGSEILRRLAVNYSVNPRLLLTLLEYQSGWVTEQEPREETLLYPFGRAEGGTEGLFRQLQWAVNALNTGFYSWREGRLSIVILSDGARAALAPRLNAGTAAVQSFFALTRLAPDWAPALAPDGFAATYAALFGDPFARAVEPLLPPDLAQPFFDLPWEPGQTWYFSGGPHNSFGPGSPWGALDFVPPDDNVGCYVSEVSVTAVATGLVVRTGFGQVMLDLDQDGFEQTGWNVLYYHLENETHALEQTIAARGTHLGRASCDGGSATGAHLHLARKYNGVWLTSRDVPFQLGEYTVHMGASQYEGVLATEDAALQACDCRIVEINGVAR